MSRRLSSLRSKLIAAFSFILVVVLVLGGASLYGMQQLAGKTSYVSDQLLPRVAMLSKLRGDIYHVRVDVLFHVANPTAEGKVEAVTKVEKRSAEIEQGIADYRPLATSPEEQATLNAIAENWQGFRDGMPELMKRSSANHPETFQFYEDAVASYSGGMTDAIEAQLAADTERANVASAEAQALRDLLLTLVSVAVGLAVIATIASGVAITLSISRSIKKLVDPMGKLAAGDLSIDVPAFGEKTEFGQIASALRVFKSNMVEADRMRADQADGQHRVEENATMMAGLQREIAAVVNAGIEGDFSRRIEAKFGSHELDTLAQDVNKLVQTVDLGLTETSEVLASIAKAELDRRVNGKYSGSFGKLKTDTNAVADRLADIVGQLKTTSAALKTATGEILSGANDLSERTTKQASAVEESSAAIGQLAMAVSENAKKAESAATMAQSASRLADEGGKVMLQANEAMERITASSGKISNIIGLIDDIAFQTNLLALNASVEAARAGESGKGFAVVAVEVRRLAQSAAQASAEVKNLIEQSASEVREGSNLVAEAAGKLELILNSVQQNSEMMDSISMASREQSSSIQDVTATVRQMDEMTQHNAALVEETNAAIEQTEAQATELDRIVDIFRLGGAASRSSDTEARQGGVKALQSRVKQAAKSYLSHGNAAVAADWNEF